MLYAVINGNASIFQTQNKQAPSIFREGPFTFYKFSFADMVQNLLRKVLRNFLKNFKTWNFTEEANKLYKKLTFI